MSDKKINRKIAVIFATDVVGYSKHMEADESETILNLRECEALLLGLFEKYEGRLFNTGGDSFLAEFPSAVSAVECAVEFQNAIQERNSKDDVSIKLEFRIGINSGDVVKEKGNLLGDGVNIAARLEALAQTGGITISKSIYEFVQGKTRFEYNDLGVQKVKQNEFHAFDLLVSPSQKRKINTSKSSSSINPRNIIIAVIFLIFAVWVFAYSGLINAFFGQSTLIGESETKSSIPLVLVRPIKTTGNTQDNTNIAVGFTESMISTLSKYNGLKVLSSSTSFHIAEENFTNQRVREEYNVDYSLEGTLQIFGSSSRLTMSLNDLREDKVIWSENSDFELVDVFAVQDSLGSKILENLQITVTGSQVKSLRDEVSDLETLTEVLNHRSEWRRFTPEGYKNSEAILRDLEKKIANTGLFYNFSSWQLFQKISLGFSNNIEIDKRDLRSNIQKAIEVRGNADDYALKALMEFYIFSNGCELAQADADKAASLGGTMDVYTIIGSVYSGCDDLPNAVKYSKMALELSPNDNGWFITNNLVSYLYRLGRYEEIRAIVEDKIDSKDMMSSITAIFASIEVKAGNSKNAERLLNRAKAKGLNKESIRNLLNRTQAAEGLISDLLQVGSLE